MPALHTLLKTALVAITSVSATPIGFPHRRSALVPSLSGSAVDIASGTYPRATTLQDGGILGTYATTDGDNKILELVTSTDSGASWTSTGSAAQRPSNSSDLDNPFPFQLPSGRVLLAYRNHDKVEGSKSNYTYFRITISYSDDNGATWSYLSDPISYAGAQYHGAWEPFLRTTVDGNTLQLYWAQESSQADQDLLMLSSTDGGSTWSNQQTIAGADLQSRDGMVGIAPMSSNSDLIAVFESDDTVSTNLFTVHSVTSSDDGVTWGNRQLVYSPNGTQTNAGSPQVINVGGTLVASFMTDEDTEDQTWTDGASGKLLTSGDYGQTWSDKLEVFTPSSYWPGMLSLDNFSFLYLATQSGKVWSQEVVLS